MADEIRTVVIDRPGVTPADATVVPVYMRPIVATLIRVGRTYAQALVGFLAIVGVTDGRIAGGIAPGDFWSALVTAAGYALAPAAVALIWNVLELLNRVDEVAPEWRG